MLTGILSPAFWTPSLAEWIVIAIVAVVLFGSRLPELGRLLGEGIVQFRKGLSGMKDEIEKAASQPVEPDGGKQNEAGDSRKPS